MQLEKILYREEELSPHTIGAIDNSDFFSELGRCEAVIDLLQGDLANMRDYLVMVMQRNPLLSLYVPSNDYWVKAHPGFSLNLDKFVSILSEDKEKFPKEIVIATIKGRYLETYWVGWPPKEEIKKTIGSTESSLKERPNWIEKYILKEKKELGLLDRIAFDLALKLEKEIKPCRFKTVKEWDCKSREIYRKAEGLLVDAFRVKKNGEELPRFRFMKLLFGPKYKKEEPLYTKDELAQVLYANSFVDGLEEGLMRTEELLKMSLLFKHDGGDISWGFWEHKNGDGEINYQLMEQSRDWSVPSERWRIDRH